MTLWRIRATIDDRPGYLSVLTASLALRSVNILSVQVHATEAGAVDDFLVDAPDVLDEADLLAAVIKGRGRDAWISRSDVRGLVDTQTQLLGLSTRLVNDPDDLGATLATLIDGAEVSWSPQPCPADRDFGEGSMSLPDPAGGTLTVRREDPPFTPAEFARAHALVDLARAVLRRSAQRWNVLLPDGGEITVRPAAAADADAVVALHAECSPASRLGRYLGTAGQPSPAEVTRRLVAPDRFSLVAEAEPGGRVLAVADVVREGVQARVGVLVADAHQRRGIGTALLRRAARLAAHDGVAALHGYARPENSAAARVMRRLRLPLRTHVDGRVVTATVDLRPDAASGGAADGGDAAAPRARDRDAAHPGQRA